MQQQCIVHTLRKLQTDGEMCVSLGSFTIVIHG